MLAGLVSSDQGVSSSVPDIGRHRSMNTNYPPITLSPATCLLLSHCTCNPNPLPAGWCTALHKWARGDARRERAEGRGGRGGPGSPGTS